MDYQSQEKFLQDKLSEFAQQMKEVAEKVISDVEVSKTSLLTFKRH